MRKAIKTTNVFTEYLLFENDCLLLYKRIQPKHLLMSKINMRTNINSMINNIISNSLSQFCSSIW